MCLCGADACRGSFLMYASHAAGAAQPQQQVSPDETPPEVLRVRQHVSAQLGTPRPPCRLWMSIMIRDA